MSQKVKKKKQKEEEMKRKTCKEWNLTSVDLATVFTEICSIHLALTKVGNTYFLIIPDNQI